MLPKPIVYWCFEWPEVFVRRADAASLKLPTDENVHAVEHLRIYGVRTLDRVPGFDIDEPEQCFVKWHLQNGACSNLDICDEVGDRCAHHAWILVWC